MHTYFQATRIFNSLCLFGETLRAISIFNFFCMHYNYYRQWIRSCVYHVQLEVIGSLYLYTAVDQIQSFEHSIFDVCNLLPTRLLRKLLSRDLWYTLLKKMC